jgi:transposase-like protein
MTLTKLDRTFTTEDHCRAYLEKIRWPNGPKCLKCGANAWTLACRFKYECSVCHYQFSIRVGTIFEKTHLSLRLWFKVIFLMSESKKGMSACQIKRMFGIHYRSAWYLCHRVRTAMRTDPVTQRLGGELEIDETYVGPKTPKPGRPGKGSSKIPVVGIIERGGRVRAIAMPSMKIPNMYEFIRNTIKQDNVKVVYTDEWSGYKFLKWYVTHKTINHSVTYSQGRIHTNTIESFWSLLKRGIVGSFHKISVKHLPRYLDEFSFRFNARKEESVLALILQNFVRPHMPYRELIA